MAADFAQEILEGIPTALPDPPDADPEISRAPGRALTLNAADQRRALKNALRYFPAALHPKLAPEFAAELRDCGRRDHHA